MPVHFLLKVDCVVIWYAITSDSLWKDKKLVGDVGPLVAHIGIKELLSKLINWDTVAHPYGSHHDDIS